MKVWRLSGDRWAFDWTTPIREETFPNHGPFVVITDRQLIELLRQLQLRRIARPYDRWQPIPKADQ